MSLPVIFGKAEESSADSRILTSALCCPDDGDHPLRATSAGLECASCGRRFPAEEGILQMLPINASISAHEAAEVNSEQAQRDKEATEYDRLLGLKLLSRFEIPLTLGPLCISAADRLVEVGCGTGRMTVHVARKAGAVMALDHSLESLRVLRRKLDASSARVVQLVQADAGRLPVRDAWATRALSCQMLEHLPSAALRERAVAELARVLEPGARFALSAYQRLPLLPAEGHHSGSIYFHRFTKAELASLLNPHLSIEGLTGRLVYILLAHGSKLPTPNT